MELEHFRRACELLEQYGKKDAREVVPERFAKPIQFESNVDYVRDVLKNQPVERLRKAA